MAVTIRDVSAKSGLSISTVSKVFNNYGDISEETKIRVKTIAEQIGYYPNAIARTLKTNHSYNLGFLYDELASSGLTHPFFAEVINAFKSEAETHGYDITFINHHAGTSSMTFLEHCRYRNVDGVCLAGMDFFSEEVLELINSDLPCAVIDHVFPSQISIVSENKQGLQQLVNYAVSRGHKKIAFIHGELNSSVTKDRIQGYIETMTAHNLEIPSDFIQESQYINPKKCREKCDLLLSLPDPPTCIIVPDDYSYLGAIETAIDHHLTIGKDISFAGYDGLRLTQMLKPRLTTIRQNTKRMGREAADQIINRIEHPNSFQYAVTHVSGKLLEGNTVSLLLD